VPVLDTRRRTCHALSRPGNGPPPRYSAGVAARCSALALVALLTVGSTACGGSKSPAQQYAAKLSSMCEDFAAREQKIGEPTSPEDLAARGDRIVAAFEETILQPIRSLDAPPEIASQAAQLRILARQQRDVLRELAAAGRSGDLQRVRQLVQRNTTLNAQAGLIADRLGAGSCTS
jgi:hypothetical protein